MALPARIDRRTVSTSTTRPGPFAPAADELARYQAARRAELMEQLDARYGTQPAATVLVRCLAAVLVRLELAQAEAEAEGAGISPQDLRRLAATAHDLVKTLELGRQEDAPQRLRAAAEEGAVLVLQIAEVELVDQPQTFQRLVHAAQARLQEVE